MTKIQNQSIRYSKLEFGYCLWFGLPARSRFGIGRCLEIGASAEYAKSCCHFAHNATYRKLLSHPFSQLPFNNLFHLLHGNQVHATVVRRTSPFHTGTAVNVFGDDLMIAPPGAGHPRGR